MRRTPVATNNPDDFILDPQGAVSINYYDAYHRAATAPMERRMHVSIPSPESFAKIWREHSDDSPGDATGFMKLITALVKSTSFKTYACSRVTLVLKLGPAGRTYKYEVVVFEGEIITVRQARDD